MDTPKWSRVENWARQAFPNGFRDGDFRKKFSVELFLAIEILGQWRDEGKLEYGWFTGERDGHKTYYDMYWLPSQKGPD